ncbi:AAA family ATPase [Pelagicoccus sp. SDUM812002]|uniref:AAA family ATPase n=1 Tax=Pelagicoccus sp. SDUM812002 TaxID=3041266 RepID=UPI00280EFCCC|nr:AAA family ATPase [Pelagicoccus sp. SDUM812002]MDQ8185675.1 AAA family ATPase [Pelagicoccus sp. SDUM812002]
MIRTIIFGNSGSGKSTLAHRLASSERVEHLDLDTLAWKEPGVRQDIELSTAQIVNFISRNEQWVIEGCYASLIEAAIEHAREIIFLNPGTESCQNNCRSRPWEPHKYASKEDQDKNLAMLLDWVAQYPTRGDEFSLAAHQELFASFCGKKHELKSNEEAQSFTCG